MFKIKSLTVRNFMSVGNSTQAVDFDRRDLTLVLGENLDLGGDDSGARNGTGKTTIINALSYALYGNALTNIKKDNLINKITELELTSNNSPSKYKLAYRQVSDSHMIMQVGLSKVEPIESILLEQTDFSENVVALLQSKLAANALLINKQ